MTVPTTAKSKVKSEIKSGAQTITENSTEFNHQEVTDPDPVAAYFPLSEREAQWAIFSQQYLEPFWQSHRLEKKTITTDGIELSHVFIENTSSNKLIILLPGRVESYLKYKEVIYDIYHSGYSVLSLDHRGQGQSERLLSDSEKGHVGLFTDYADDLNQILDEQVNLSQFEQVSVVAHSMGAAIALDWQHRYKPQLHKLVLLAPMLGINAGPLSQKGAKWVAKIVDFTQAIFNREPPYFFGQKPYQAHDYHNNHLCRSLVRYQQGQAIVAQFPLGGVTTTWLNQSLKLINQLPVIARDLKFETLLLQAEQELIVSLRQQDVFTTQAKNKIKKVLVKQAHHEILMEQDSIRCAVIADILDFLR